MPDKDQPRAGAEFGAAPGSALRSIVISEIQAQFAQQVTRAIKGQQIDTLAGWWCELNAREWPGDWGLQRPVGDDGWASNFARNVIEGLVSKEHLLLAWQCYEDEKEPNASR